MSILEKKTLLVYIFSFPIPGISWLTTISWLSSLLLTALLCDPCARVVAGVDLNHSDPRRHALFELGRERGVRLGDTADTRGTSSRAGQRGRAWSRRRPPASSWVAPVGSRWSSAKRGQEVGNDDADRGEARSHAASRARGRRRGRPRCAVRNTARRGTPATGTTARPGTHDGRRGAACS